MIPKKIHYCWFGRNPLPESAQKCIASWRKYLPDYEIIEWNEDNFDIDSIPYTAQAYQAKKYAFVSDYARFKILYEQGGLYFDTDVEIIRNMDDIISAGPFMGFEINPDPKTGYCGAVAPGLGLGAEKNMEIYEQIINAYNDFQFVDDNGNLNQTTVVSYTTDILKSVGLSSMSGIQTFSGLTIYPGEYFNPLDSLTGRLKITSNTYSIHWYTMSWLNQSPLRTKFSRLLHRFISPDFTSKIKQKLR